MLIHTHTWGSMSRLMLVKHRQSLERKHHGCKHSLALEGRIKDVKVGGLGMHSCLAF